MQLRIGIERGRVVEFLRNPVKEGKSVSIRWPESDIPRIIRSTVFPRLGVNFSRPDYFAENSITEDTDEYEGFRGVRVYRDHFGYLIPRFPGSILALTILFHPERPLKITNLELRKYCSGTIPERLQSLRVT